MRKRKYEITDQVEIGQILSRANIGRLATRGEDGFPYIVPVNFVNMEGKIYFHCAKAGEKLDNISADPRVCFEVDIPLSYLDTGFERSAPACRVTQFYQSVIIRGNAAIVRDDNHKLSALNALMEKHEKGRDFEPVEKGHAGFKACEVVMITPVSVSAKCNLAQGETGEKKKEISQYLFRRNFEGDRSTSALLNEDKGRKTDEH